MVLVNRRVIYLCTLLLLTACQQSPSKQFQQQALALGFTPQLIKTAQFQHKIYFNHLTERSNTLHVYLDGDGTPWENNRWISDDPTARNPLILRLMAEDKTDSIILGRPCYYGLSHSFACHHRYWTSHRYAAIIVESMVNALTRWLQNKHYTELVLIGYSGGGTLAVLMAERIKGVNIMIVTIAANLDIVGWQHQHHYLPLQGSMNPVDRPPLNPEIRQFHFAGKDDTTIPASLIKKYVQQQQQAQYFELRGQTHSCCWEQKWQQILQWVTSP